MRIRTLVALTVFALSCSQLPKPGFERREWREEHRRARVGNAGDETKEVTNAAEQFAQARTAPGLVQPGAYSAAFASLQALPTYGREAWKEVTTRPYNSDDPRYRDPFASNSSGGAGNVAGRITGLAVGGGVIYAGGADGGVFRSSDGGATWAPLTDGLPTLSVGDVELAPDGALWLATGEGNTGATSYVGSGVYRLANPSKNVFTTSTRVGGTELESTFINQIKFDTVGNVYAATSRGVWKHSAATGSGAWTRVLLPVPGSTSPYDNICNDVAIAPLSNGTRVIANCAWRGGAAYNGFYFSYDGGNTWAKANPTGALNPQDIGNTEFAYSADGTHLYAVVESITKYTNNVNTALAGVFDAPGGDINGPWNKIATSDKLGGTDSALHDWSGRGYSPGIQAWYNNFIIVDPADSKHVFVGLEEVYETRDAGGSWITAAPYWNFDFPCWSFLDSQNTCPPAPHSDQHSVAIAGGKVYIGNDGGAYVRNLDGSGVWKSLNANLRTLQYYSVGAGKVAGGVAISGGLQDNGGSLLLPEDATGSMGSPFGGDSGDVLVDPDDGCKIMGEYVFLDLEVTTNCGRSDGSVHSIIDVNPGDPNPRFIAPFGADETNKNHWVAGGQSIWTFDRGFAIASGSDWRKVFDNGFPHSTTALTSRNDVIWSAWCGPCNNDGFTRGISTNAGGAWHQLALPSDFPNRYISGLAVSPADPSGKTAYVAFNGFSRTWTEGPGAGIGHVWKTTDAGATWTNVSGNFPDIPANRIVIRNGKLIVATDLGTLISTDDGAHWSRLGSGAPYTTVMYLSVGPDGKLYAATHGRGIWSISAP
ncbi:MAG TPA: glycosyl hydrolase [Thermoanaerobaculia bacterium]|jgi:sugar lactone lactonase YvrE